MNAKYDFVFYLKIQLWQVLNNSDPSEYVIKIYMPSSFSDVKYYVKMKQTTGEN